MNRRWLISILLSSLFSSWAAANGAAGDLTLLPPELRIEGAPADAVSVEYYRVEGATLEELRAALRKNGPVDQAGVSRDAHAGWHMTWRWPRRADGSPDFGAVVVRCTARVTLPRWEPTPETDARVVREWDRYLRAIMNHERRHVEHCFLDRERVRAAIVGAAAERPDFTTDEAHRVAREILKETRARDRALDKNTDHGRKEGAILAKTLDGA